MRFSLKQLVRIAVLIISFGLSVSSARTIYDLWKRQDVVSVREAELRLVKERNDALTKQLADTKNDAYVEREARNKLGMVRNGETIVILPNTAAKQIDSAYITKLPNWKRWLGLFF
jgi:cell division protein DivIC